ncbi:hypothetical protein [Holdemania massiliensis]|uniref:portal protein n=1 Tax=Holdemania massiliensis TaxID=1468449 RepID=UPI0026767AD3|nr:hypothetical protein [Holdemania massiliensis]
MKVSKDPKGIKREYDDSVSFNTKIELYDNVKKNHNFYIGKQWEGVYAPDLDKPVMNFIKRVIGYQIAMLVSDDIGVSITPFNEDDQDQQMLSKVIAKEIDRALEKSKFKAKTRKILKEAAITGDGCFYFRFDPSAETGQKVKGIIQVDQIDAVNIMFGNPYSTDVQIQPYILISQRRSIESVKLEAEGNGLNAEQIDSIKPDNDSTQVNDDDTDKLCTVIIKLYKENKTVEEADEYTGLPIKKEVKTVKFMKTVGDIILKEEVDTGMTLYPIAFMNWEEQKNCYHGQSPITGLIPNQIFVNKLFAMCMVFVINNGFPKLLYDSGKVAEITNAVNDAIAIERMDLAGDLLRYTQTPDFSNQILQLIDTCINYTRDFMGASDAALGNVKPDNTSAIIATQQATAIPLENQRLNFFDFVEDSVRIMVDMMAAYYGIRQAKIESEDDMQGGIIDLDFSMLREMNYDLNVDIGASSYWSELVQAQTMDNLLTKGVIQDAVTYLENIPDHMVKNKQKLIDSIKKKQLEQEQQAQAMALAQAGIDPVAMQQSPADNAGLI